MLSLVAAIDAIKVTALHVPAHVPAHSAAHLVCHQDLEGSALYTVKWFKNGREFFRFAPFVIGNPKKYFDTAGVDVDVSSSNADSAARLAPDGAGRFKLTKDAFLLLSFLAGPGLFSTSDTTPR